VADAPTTVHIVGMSAQHAADRSGPPPQVLTQWGVDFTNPAGDRTHITWLMSDGSLVREGGEESQHPFSVEEVLIAHLAAARESSELSVPDPILGL